MSDERDKQDEVSSAGQNVGEFAARPAPGGSEGYELAPEPQPASSGPASSSVSTPPAVSAQAPTAPSPSRSDRPTPFVQGFGGIRFTATLLGGLLLAALVIVGVRAGSLGFQQVLVHLASAVLQVAAYGSLGALAAIAAARCVGTRVAEPELFALRMLAATAAYQLLFATGTPIPTRIDDRILGMAGYATTVWLLFKLTPRETGLVAIWHFGLASLLWLSMAVSSVVVEPKPAPNQPGSGELGVSPQPTNTTP
ncbi:MAG: hypothetical protein KJZ65_10240 [Phycisphaerales bacterium]|nr:hypothetical protein [Phycisphaerales bacterium]